MSQTEVKGNAHLIDEHDGENGLVDMFGFAAGEKEKERERRQGGEGGHLAQHVAKIGADCDDSEVGQRSTKFSLREALDSLQDDIELSSLAGTDGNTCGLNKTKKERAEVSVNCRLETFFFPFFHLSCQILYPGFNNCCLYIL